MLVGCCLQSDVVPGVQACGAVNVDYHFLQRLFHIMDTDESGAVDFDEFLVFVETMYGNFDVGFGHFSCMSQLHVTPHTPCAMIYLVPVFITC